MILPFLFFLSACGQTKAWKKYPVSLCVWGLLPVGESVRSVPVDQLLYVGQHRLHVYTAEVKRGQVKEPQLLDHAHNVGHVSCNMVPPSWTAKAICLKVNPSMSMDALCLLITLFIHYLIFFLKPQILRVFSHRVFLQNYNDHFQAWMIFFF